ncbi:MAG: HD domain-containing protein [Alkalicoccus sp.]|nr:MAG: HD domain-containing protein [Alkalicoccus sp.]
MRVRSQAVSIAQEEGADVLLCELAALLHDVSDEKFHHTQSSGKEYLQQWMIAQDIPPAERNKLNYIVESVSFKGGSGQVPETLEAGVVQDADRLDAIGAVGIARCFMYAGSHGSPMHDPEQRPRYNLTEQEYRDNSASAVTHFYEKLLTLKDTMNTPSGKKRAEKRHERLENFLDEFYSEWNGNS